MQYSHTTGAGIIINAHKKLFDFKLIHWHDKTRIPEMDLLVEFRTDSENNTSVVYIKSSKYQEFSQDSIIKERDFWKTQTDEELEKLEIAVFEGLVEQTYKKTDYAILNNIKPSISVDSFIEYHFENETNIINHANDLPTDGYEILDYRIVARFLMRTLDTLVYAEKRITKDTFSMYLQLYSKLQYYTTAYYKASQDTAKVFSEIFLVQQLYFASAKQKIINLNDDILQNEHKWRNLKSQINILNNRILNHQVKNVAETQSKIDDLSKQMKETNNFIAKLEQTKARIQKLMQLFIAQQKKEFIAKFEIKKAEIFKLIKDAINITITSLDNRIWQLGMQSEPIKNHFFKLQSSFSFCILAFIQQYIKTLDSSKLSDADRLLNIYITRYKERNTKKILLISNDEKMKFKLKIEILSLYKNFMVTSISKKMEYEILITNHKFDFIIMDMNIAENLADMVAFGKSKRLNKNAEFIVYDF